MGRLLYLFCTNRRFRVPPDDYRVKAVSSAGKGTPHSWQGYYANERERTADSVAALDRASGPHRTGMYIDAELNTFVLRSDIFTQQNETTFATGCQTPLRKTSFYPYARGLCRKIWLESQPARKTYRD